MASEILFQNITNEYLQFVSGSNNIVPPGTNPNDLNIRIVAIVPAAVTSLSAVTGNILTVNSAQGSFTEQLTTPNLTSSNCSSKKLVIT